MPEPLPPVMWHHGRCDLCQQRLILVCHFGYDERSGKSFRACEPCLESKAGLVWNPHSTYSRVMRAKGRHEWSRYRKSFTPQQRALERTIRQARAEYSRGVRRKEEARRRFEERYFPKGVCSFMRRLP